MRLLAYLLVCLGLCITELGIATSEDAVFIGQQRELFLDSDLIRTANGITLQLHEAKPREVILVTDEPWEGNTCAYYTIFQDGDKYRMYYRGSHWDESKKRATHPEVVCYAESTDGIHWQKPELGICEFEPTVTR